MQMGWKIVISVGLVFICILAANVRRHWVVRFDSRWYVFGDRSLFYWLIGPREVDFVRVFKWALGITTAIILYIIWE